MSRMREVVAEPGPTASVWKASKHRLVGGSSTPDYIEATPDAAWARTDPFRAYRPVVDRGGRSDPSPHETFSKLADMALESDPTDKETKLFHMAVKLFANRYGLLGVFREEFGAPLLPGREVSISVHIAPDTVVDRNGKLRGIDPATEGKWLQEKRMLHFDEVMLAMRGEPPPHPGDYLFEPEQLIMPNELRFQKTKQDFVQTGIARLPSDRNHDEMFTYEEVQRRYGVRVVYDPLNEDTGVSVISTREPVSMWRQMLFNFAPPLYLEILNRHLEDVRPLLVVDKDGEATSSWTCPSLLKAVHLMRYLDLVAGVKMQRCQAPGCREYFRVGPRSRESLYCPPPPGKKQSKCASRASSAMYRERQRRNT